jgi:hypothetical protein
LQCSRPTAPSNHRTRPARSRPRRREAQARPIADTSFPYLASLRSSNVPRCRSSAPRSKSGAETRFIGWPVTRRSQTPSSQPHLAVPAGSRSAAPAIANAPGRLLSWSPFLAGTGVADLRGLRADGGGGESLRPATRESSLTVRVWEVRHAVLAHALSDCQFLLHLLLYDGRRARDFERPASLVRRQELR